jgi:hypothetical protein
VARFESIVAGWDAADVVNFTRLLERLEVDKHAVAERKRRRSRRPRWADSEKQASRVGAPDDRGTQAEERAP